MRSWNALATVGEMSSAAVMSARHVQEQPAQQDDRDHARRGPAGGPAPFS
ncbi:hypothetical protein [Streptomyces sp. NPDC056660]